MSGNTLVVTKV